MERRSPYPQFRGVTAADNGVVLSQRRADAVQYYLVTAIGIKMEIDRQRPNRRVVIVVHTDAR